MGSLVRVSKASWGVQTFSRWSWKPSGIQAEVWSRGTGVSGSDPGRGGGGVSAGLAPDGRAPPQDLGQRPWEAGEEPRPLGGPLQGARALWAPKALA